MSDDLTNGAPITPPPRVKKPTPWTLQKQPKVKNNSPEQRKRGEIERRRLGYRIDPEVPEGSWRFDAIPSILDAGGHLEQHTGKLIGLLLKMADETKNPHQKQDICFKLLQLSSLGRARVDITAQLAKADVPDLSALPPDQLLEIIRKSQTMNGPITIELPEKTDTSVREGTTE